MKDAGERAGFAPALPSLLALLMLVLEAPHRTAADGEPKVQPFHFPKTVLRGEKVRVVCSAASGGHSAELPVAARRAAPERRRAPREHQDLRRLLRARGGQRGRRAQRQLHVRAQEPPGKRRLLRASCSSKRGLFRDSGPRPTPREEEKEKGKEGRHGGTLGGKMKVVGECPDLPRTGDSSRHGVRCTWRARLTIDGPPPHEDFASHAHDDPLR
ncbi:hypothetical protein MRX96_037226 [Rhipicephalus microplus]